MATTIICDICKKNVQEDPFRSRRHGAGVNDLRGFFAINYYRAVKKRDGSVRNYQYDSSFVICEDCRRLANEALWTAFSPVISANTEDTVEVKLSGFDPIEEENA